MLEEYSVRPQTRPEPQSLQPSKLPFPSLWPLIPFVGRRTGRDEWRLRDLGLFLKPRRSGESALSGKFQRLQGCAPGPGRIAVGHHMNRNVRLFLALIRHAGADLSQKPLLEFRAGFKDTTAHDQSIGVESIDHFIEKQSQRVSLNPKNLFAHGISLVRQPANELGRLMSILFCQRMGRIALQKIWKECFLNRGERTKRFQVADSSAIA